MLTVETLRDYGANVEEGPEHTLGTNPSGAGETPAVSG